MFIHVGFFWIFLISSLPFAMILLTASDLIFELATRFPPFTTALIENPRNSEVFFYNVDDEQ